MSRFDSVSLSPEQLESVNFFRKAFGKLETNIDIAVPNPSREKALVLTHLEDAAMWLNKAISRSVPVKP